MMQYGDFAYVYDRLMHEDIDYDKWCDYIENTLAAHDCEPQAICELACGTGNITARLAGRGYEMTGIDISADMLSEAADKLKNTPLLCMDMTKFVPKRKFDAFLCMIDGINYVIVPAALMRMFRNVKEALKDDGVFMFDISTRYKLKNVIGDNTFIHSDRDVFYSWQNAYYERYGICDMLLNFFVRSGKGEYRRFEERHAQRGWTEKELRSMLKTAGFKEIHVYDELSDTPPKSDSERIVFVCR